jgi:PAS domain S-box-containing protein
MQDDLTSSLTASLMAQLFDVASDAMIVIDAQQSIMRFNHGAEQIFGYRASEVLGHSLAMLLPERFAQAHQTHVQQFGAGDNSAREMGERRAISGRRKNGSEFPAAAGISKLEQGRQQLFAVILRDVTEQRHLEDEARTQSTQAAIAAERSRLARDLHDAVTQSLFSASIMAEMLPKLWESDRDKGLAQLQDIRLLTRSALAEMRTLLLELRPSAIMDGKLSELLVQLAEATSCRSGVNVTVNADEQRRLPGDVQVAFYRIAQEALHNVSKHSRAKVASVQLSLLVRNASLLVHDDGRGFEYTGIGATHLGLRIMHERAEDVGATVQIESAPGQGTDVLVNWSEK